MRAIEKLFGHISPTRNLKRQSIIGGDLNLLQADWAGEAGKESGVQALVNNLICDNGYTQVYANPQEGLITGYLSSQTGECAHLMQRIAQNQQS